MRGHAGDHDALEADVAALAAAVAATGGDGPVLVIADHETIGRLGPRWSRLFAAVGRPYRVRLGGGGAAIPADDPTGRADPRDIADARAEADALGAALLVGAGAASVVEAARRAAAERGLPFVAARAPAN
jgi:hypothetical protein